MRYCKGEKVLLPSGQLGVVRASKLHKTDNGWGEYVLVQDLYANESDVFYNHHILQAKINGSLYNVSNEIILMELEDEFLELLSNIY